MRRIVYAASVVVLLFAVAILMIAFPSGEIGKRRPVACMNTARPESLTVTAQVAPEGVMMVTPSNGFTSTGRQGGPFDPASIVYTLKNTSSAPINWTASKTQAWLALSALGGKIQPGETATLTVAISSNSLTPNTYTDTVTFTNKTNGSGNTTRQVKLTVVTPGVLTVTPSYGLTATGGAGGPFGPSSFVYMLQNTGGAPITWVVERTQSWITLSPVSGTLAPGVSITVAVSINSNANSLAANTYTDTVTFKNTTKAGDTSTRPVSLTVMPAGELTPTPSNGLNSKGMLGGPFDPASIVYTLQNTGGTTINWTAAKTQPWITLSPAGGTLGPGASVAVTVSINSNATSLAWNNIYLDTVTFTNTTNGRGNTTRPVSLMVTYAWQLGVTPPNGLTSTGPAGGPFDPASIVYTLWNPGGVPANWTAVKSQSWITLSPGGGTLAPRESVTVTVSINSNASALPANTYTDTVFFVNTADTKLNTTREVRLTVTAAGILTVVTSSDPLELTWVAGGPFWQERDT